MVVQEALDIVEQRYLTLSPIGWAVVTMLKDQSIDYEKPQFKNRLLLGLIEDHKCPNQSGAKFSAWCLKVIVINQYYQSFDTLTKSFFASKQSITKMSGTLHVFSYNLRIMVLDLSAFNQLCL